jgi:hypothetical protein
LVSYDNDDNCYDDDDMYDDDLYDINSDSDNDGMMIIVMIMMMLLRFYLHTFFFSTTLFFHIIYLGNYETIYEPTLIEHMKHLKIASVSCGNSTTIVSTEVIYEWIGDGSDDNERYRRLKGGEVYITGSRNVFGEQYDIFTKLLITPPDNSDDAPVCIKQVAAGFLHSVLVSSDGELYCWGHNKTGDTTILLLYNSSSLLLLSTPLSSSSLPLLLSSLSTHAITFFCHTYTYKHTSIYTYIHISVYLKIDAV